MEKRGHANRETPEEKRARTVQSQPEVAFIASDASSIDLSTDPSQHDYNAKYHYKPVSREEWVATLPEQKSNCEPASSNPVQTARQEYYRNV